MQKDITDKDLPDQNELRRFFEEHEDEYNEERIRERAREDAKLNIPRADSEDPSPFEEELRHATEQLASKVVSKYNASLEMIDAKIRSVQTYVKKDFRRKRDNTETIYDIHSDAAENAFELTSAHKEFEVAEKRYNDLHDKHGRAPIIYVPHWLYMIFAFLIFIGEIPLNALVFQIFGENQVMTWIMAFIIGLAIPLTAHFIGIKMREHGSGFSGTNALKGLAVFGVVTAALYGLSIMRQTYLGEFKEELGLTDTLVESSFMFFWLNVAVLTAAVIVAYLSHDSIPELERAEREYRRAKKKVSREERRRVKELKSAGSKRAHGLHGVGEGVRDGVSGIKLMKGKYDQVLKEGQEYEARCLSRLKKTISIYRHENLRHRDNATTPKSFKRELEFPLKLAKMQEKLNNDSQPDQKSV